MTTVAAAVAVAVVAAGADAAVAGIVFAQGPRLPGTSRPMLPMAGEFLSILTI